MSEARVVGYDLYKYWPDQSGSDFCFRYQREQDALISLGVIRGWGDEGYINRVVAVTEEREERLDA